MDQLNQLLNAELDSDYLETKEQAKQQKGFNPTGIKKVAYIGKNLLQVEDAGGGADYIMDYIPFRRILEAFPFKAKAVETAIGNLLTGHDIVFDFSSHKIFLWYKPPKKNIIGEGLTHIKENYDEELGRVYGDDPMDEKEWNNLLYKTS